MIAPNQSKRYKDHWGFVFRLREFTIRRVYEATYLLLVQLRVKHKTFCLFLISDLIRRLLRNGYFQICLHFAISVFVSATSATF